MQIIIIYLLVLFFSFSLSCAAKEKEVDPLLSKKTKYSSGCDVRLVGLKDKQSVISFHNKLVKNIKKNKVKSISEMVRYPLRFNSKIDLDIKSEKDFIANYDSIFTDSNKKVIENQDINKFFCKSTGIMYGSGSVWINKLYDSDEIKIISVSSY